jgi:hypothetical protein
MQSLEDKDKRRTEILNHFHFFEDGFGIVHPTPLTISHNGLRFTAEKLFALKFHGCLNESDKIHFRKLFSDFEKPAGLLMRHPYYHVGMQQGPDDYVAAIAASAFLGGDQAERIYNYGKKNYFYYNNTDSFTWSALMGRQPQLISHMLFAQNKTPNLALRFAWALAVSIGSHSRRGDQDGRMLSYFLIKAAQGKSSFCDKVAAEWSKSLRRVYSKGGIGEVLADYYQNPSHPAAKYLWGEFADTKSHPLVP